jgi:hypothetical protein
LDKNDFIMSAKIDRLADQAITMPLVGQRWDCAPQEG